MSEIIYVEPTQFDHDTAERLITLGARLTDIESMLLKNLMNAYELRQTISEDELARAHDLFAFHRADGRP